MMITPVKPPALDSRLTLLSYLLGMASAAMAVAQLVSFEEFVLGIREYGAGEGVSLALAIGLIALEIGSIPLLFRLTLSPLMRMVSAVCVVLLPCAWTALIASAVLGDVGVSNVGYFGRFFGLESGGMALTLAVVWLTVVGWAFGPLGGYKALKLKG